MSRVKINKNIFEKETVLRTIEEYSDIATININETDEYYDLNFDNCKYDQEETVKEFENYLIDLTNN